MSPTPVEMRAVGKHLDYIPWVSIALEMEVAKRTDVSMLQVVQLLQNYDIWQWDQSPDGTEHPPWG